MSLIRKIKMWAVFPLSILFSSIAFASEADLVVPNLNTPFTMGGTQVSGTTLLTWSLVVALVGALFGVVEFMRVKKLPAHKSLLDISALIYETCKTYMITQAKF